MIPGLSGKHTWDGQVVLNDLTAWPRYRVERIIGLHARPDADAPADKLPGGIGEVPRRSTHGGRTIVYEGLIEAGTYAELETARDELLAAFAGTDPRQMSVTSFLTDLARPVVFFTARPVTCEVPDEHPALDRLDALTYGHERRFTVAVRAGEPRYYAAAEKNAQTSELAPTSGTPLPWTLPVVLTAPGASAGTVQAVNDGRAPTDPVVTITGPVTNPYVANDTLGTRLQLNLSLAAGATVRLDFATRAITLLSGADVTQTLDAASSDWWDDGIDGLRPGTNQLRFGGDAVQDPAHAVFTYHDAYWS